MSSHQAHFAPSPAIERTISRLGSSFRQMYQAWTILSRLVSDAIHLAHAEENGHPMPSGPLNRIQGHPKENRSQL